MNSRSTTAYRKRLLTLNPSGSKYTSSGSRYTSSGSIKCTENQKTHDEEPEK